MIGTVRRMSARKSSFSENEWKSRESSPGLLLRSTLPPVTEARIVLDLREGRIDVAEFLPDALDEGADIGPVACFAVARHEAFAVHDVVDLAVADVAVGIFREIGDDVELGKRQADIDVVPGGPARVVAQRQLAELGDVLAFLRRLRRELGFVAAEDEFDAPQQDREAARLFDEVDRT